MSFRHFSAVKTLKGKSGFWLKKCLFSVTRASAPTHSVYAAIKASAGLKPLASYFAPNSKGIKKSSSMVVRVFITLINIEKSSGERWRRTSSIIVRGIRKLYNSRFSIISYIRFLQAGIFTRPKPNIYTFESTTSSKFFLPQFFSDFAYCLNRFFFSHSLKRILFFRYAVAKLIPQFFGFCFFSFHRLSPYFKFTTKLECCQLYHRGRSFL